MLKAEAEDLLKEAADSVGKMLRASRRQDDQSCMLCWTALGEQHSPDCPCWPLVLWRQKYNDARQKEQPERADLSTPWAKRI